MEDVSLKERIGKVGAKNKRLDVGAILSGTVSCIG